jgi:hypothetical protein
MTMITAKVLGASSDKKYTLPAADDPKPAPIHPLQASAPELLRISLPRTPLNKGYMSRRR